MQQIQYGLLYDDFLGCCVCLNQFIHRFQDRYIRWIVWVMDDLIHATRIYQPFPHLLHCMSPHLSTTYLYHAIVHLMLDKIGIDLILQDCICYFISDYWILLLC